MNNYFMSGKLMHKASDHNTKRCEMRNGYAYYSGTYIMSEFVRNSAFFLSTA